MKMTLLARVQSVGAALALVVPTAVPAAHAADVPIPDPGLRQCINVHLGKPADAALAESDVASIGELDCGAIRRQRHYNIRDLSGAEHLTGATRIDLDGNSISDLTPLAGLVQLQHLDLSRNQDIVDLSALSGLSQLQSLEMYATGLRDISAITGLSTLRTLDLGATPIDDLSELAHLTRLQHLHLNNNDIPDVSDLSGLTQLETLELESNGSLTDLSPLSGLSSLRTLDLWGTNVEDFSVLAELTTLEDLTVGNAGIEDASPFAGLTRLRTLDLGSNRITDASALAKIAEQDGVALDLSDQSLTMTGTVGQAVVVPPVVDASGNQVGMARCHLSTGTLSPCSGTVSTADDGTTFTPVEPGGYHMFFEGTGPDEYSLQAFVEVTATPISGGAVFSDNPAGSRFYTPVQWMAAEGISVGYTDGTFKKNKNVSRGETARFLYRMTGQAATATQHPFPDVSTALTDAVAWFAHEGISVGYTDGTFRPNRPVTRGEFAAFLYRMDQPEDFETPKRSAFTDVKVGGSYWAAISWLESTGITTGYGNGTFKPGRTLSRAEAAAFLYRYNNLDR